MFIILVLFLDLIEIGNFIQFFSYVPFVLLQERGETVHIVSMQKNFHVECYKCEVIYLLGIIGEHYERSPLLTYSKLISFRLYSSISKLLQASVIFKGNFSLFFTLNKVLARS